MGKKLNIIRKIIQKGFCVWLAVLFSLSPVTAAVAGNRSCHKVFPINNGIKADHISATSTALPMGCCSSSTSFSLLQDCCADSHDIPCDLEKDSNINLSNITLMSTRPGSHSTFLAGVVVDDVLSGNPANQSFAQNLYGTPNRSAPIYLHTLSLLC